MGLHSKTLLLHYQVGGKLLGGGELCSMMDYSPCSKGSFKEGLCSSSFVKKEEEF